jgi:nucleotide-binding universal stress UspA family protein
MKIESNDTAGDTPTALKQDGDALTEKSPPPPVFRLKRILVPTDFSPSSAKALVYALAFAKQSQAEIILLHVVEPICYPMYGQELATDLSGFQADMVKASDLQLAKFIQDHAAGYGPLKLLVREGGAFWEIVEAAQDEDVDLIILSTHGHTGLRHVLLGSTAERVVQHAPCPVLTVRETEHEFVK